MSPPASPRTGPPLWTPWSGPSTSGPAASDSGSHVLPLLADEASDSEVGGVSASAIPSWVSQLAAYRQNRPPRAAHSDSEMKAARPPKTVGNEAEQAAGHLTEVGMPSGAGPWRDPHERVVVVDLDGGRRGGLVEVGRRAPTRRMPAPFDPGQPASRQVRVVGRLEEAPAHVEGDGRVPGHERGGVEEGGDLVERAPAAGVGRVGKGPPLVGQGQHLRHPGLRPTGPGSGPTRAVTTEPATSPCPAKRSLSRSPASMVIACHSTPRRRTLLGSTRVLRPSSTNRARSLTVRRRPEGSDRAAACL